MALDRPAPRIARLWLASLGLGAIVGFGTGCDSSPANEDADSATDPGTEAPADTDGSGEDAPTDDDAAAEDVDTALPIEERRIIAIGDVHGDQASALDALQLAGAVDNAGNWIGDGLIVVQVGDQTDRGDDEREILDWFEDLREQAEAAGGAFHPLLGNHEVMNVQLDLRYVTEGGFEDWADTPYDETDPFYAQFDEAARGRVAAFRPGGPYARLLSDHDMALQLGDTVFVHGGLTPDYAERGIDTINAEVSRWMSGLGPEPVSVRGDDCPIWSRHFSSDTDADDCALLEETLEILGAERMVVAHTVQDDGITSACDDRVWRVDVGLSDYYGGATQVLEIIGDDVRVIRP